MQFMEQIHHIPSPAMVSPWSGATIGKTIFSLILALCVLIGIAGRGTDSPTAPSMNRVGAGSTEVILLTPIIGFTHSSSPVVPAQTENSPLTGSNRASGSQGRQLAARRAAPGRGGSAQLPAAAAENGSEKLTFSGRVVGNNGIPVADAEVLYSVGSNSSESATRTGVDGTFRFEFPRPELKKWDRVSIVATHPDHAIGWQSLQPQSASEVEIQLTVPATISGKIMNEAGEPIQNAEARIQYLFSTNWKPGVRGAGLGWDDMPIPPAKTDANGKFVLRGLPQDVKQTLRLRDQGTHRSYTFRCRSARGGSSSAEA